jgi:hypothetical protein
VSIDGEKAVGVRELISHLCRLLEPGKGYHIFAGKDASKGLGMSSLKPEDAVSDYSSLDDKQLKVLDDWVSCIGIKFKC